MLKFWYRIFGINSVLLWINSKAFQKFALDDKLQACEQNDSSTSMCEWEILKKITRDHLINYFARLTRVACRSSLK